MSLFHLFYGDDKKTFVEYLMRKIFLYIYGSSFIIHEM